MKAPIEPRYPKSRIDALTDGLFGVAMTILVLDLRLPDALRADQASVAQALESLWPKFFPYALSFYVLGVTWLANIKVRSSGEYVGRKYAGAWLAYLLLVTCLPFSTAVIGRFPHLAPAVWLYSANMALLAFVGYRLVVLLPDVADDEHTLDRKVSLSLLIATSVASVAVSFVSPRIALWVYVLNIAQPWIAGRIIARSATRRPQDSR